MEDQKLNRVFDRVKLSRSREEAMLADLLREEKEVSSMKQTTRRRIPAAALVAATLVVVLAGTALAGGYFGRLDVSPVGGDYKNGYHVQGAYQNILRESLSEELLDFLAQTQKDGKELIFQFGSWSEAEEFLGLEVANNSLLDKMARSDWEPSPESDITQEDWRRCTIYMDSDRGLPDRILLHADYWSEEAPSSVTVLAYMRVKAEGQSDQPFSREQRDIENVSAEQYVTPSGLEVTIFTQDSTVIDGMDGSTFQQANYTAYFSLNNAMFELHTLFNEDKADAVLSFLKQVLDAYE